MKIIIALGISMLLVSCISTQMKNLAGVGDDINNLILVAGPPDHQFDLPDGRRAFQWYMGQRCTLTYFAIKSNKLWVVDSIRNPNYSVC